MAVEAGMMLAGVTRFRWSFITSLTGGWKVGVQRSDSLDGSGAGEFNTVKKDGAVHSEPI